METNDYLKLPKDTQFYFDLPNTVQLAERMKATKNQTFLDVVQNTASALRSEHSVSKTCCAVVYWYNVLERTLKREVKEEVGLEITNIEYVTSLATVHGDGDPSLVISCMADWVGG